MLEILAESYIGKLLATFFVSMVPVIELRGGIPFGVALDLSPFAAAAAAVVGNLVPVPFIILFIRKVFEVLARYKGTAGLVKKLEDRAHAKSETVKKYEALGLCILVAIPLPGTGAWTGALIAAILDMSLKKAMPPIALGVVIAAAIVTCLTCGVIAIAA